MNAQTLDLMLQHELPAAARGNQDAYGRIVSACQNTVTAIAYAITRDVQASEDIAQEAFLRAWQRLDRLKNSASFLPWLRQITRNLARDYLRTQHHKPMSGEAAELAINLTADPSPSPAERLLRTEEEIAAADIISSLPEDARETLLLFYREGQSSLQVAELLGLSDAAVRKRLSRARGIVREEMLKRFGEFARSTAPGAAFTVLVVSGLMGAAPVASAAIAIGAGAVGVGSASAGKLGASGLGVSSLSGGTAMGTLMGAYDTLAHGGVTAGFSLGAVIGGVVGGALGTYFGGRLLLSFADTETERAQLRRFIRMNTATAAAVGISIMVAAILSRSWVPMTLAAAIGMAVINYQCLVPLRRMMKPMVARDIARRGHKRGAWLYESMYGATGVVIASVLALGGMIVSMKVSGRF
ncbi:sigma-70 family RNA polymerase sigma factor [Pseudomonas sp. R2.Fl]|nr:sigma-70 family RNA polymerase sigma factor [Pseudomonas sp. R2.Fl]